MLNIFSVHPCKMSSLNSDKVFSDHSCKMSSLHSDRASLVNPCKTSKRYKKEHLDILYGYPLAVLRIVLTILLGPFEYILWTLICYAGIDVFEFFLEFVDFFEFKLVIEFQTVCSSSVQLNFLKIGLTFQLVLNVRTPKVLFDFLNFEQFNLPYRYSRA